MITTWMLNWFAIIVGALLLTMVLVSATNAYSTGERIYANGYCLTNPHDASKPSPDFYEMMRLMAAGDGLGYYRLVRDKNSKCIDHNFYNLPPHVGTLVSFFAFINIGNDPKRCKEIWRVKSSTEATPGKPMFFYTWLPCKTK
jgi:hypothetical protein